MDNLARHNLESDFDLKEFERQVRLDERERIYRQFYRQLTRIKQLLIQKLIGIAIIAASILMLKAGWFYEPAIQDNDVTGLLIIIPLALCLIFSNKKILY